MKPESGPSSEPFFRTHQAEKEKKGVYKAEQTENKEVENPLRKRILDDVVKAVESDRLHKDTFVLSYMLLRKERRYFSGTAEKKYKQIDPKGPFIDFFDSYLEGDFDKAEEGIVNYSIADSLYSIAPRKAELLAFLPELKQETIDAFFDKAKSEREAYEANPVDNWKNAPIRANEDYDHLYWIDAERAYKEGPIGKPPEIHTLEDLTSIKEMYYLIQKKKFGFLQQWWKEEVPRIIGGKVEGVNSYHKIHLKNTITTYIIALAKEGRSSEAMEMIDEIERSKPLRQLFGNKYYKELSTKLKVTIFPHLPKTVYKAEGGLSIVEPEGEEGGLSRPEGETGGLSESEE